jgi:general stress protein YciG
MVDKGATTVAEAGRRGGRATLENQGTDFFGKIGRKGGRRTAELYRDLLAEFGRKGGRPKRPVLDESTGQRERNRKEAAVGRLSCCPTSIIANQK